MNRVTLQDYSAVYVRLFDGSSGYLEQFRWAIAAFEHWIGRALFIDEFAEQQINDYLAYTREKLSPQTRLSRRNMLLRLWRHASTNPVLDVRPPPLNRDAIGKVRKYQRSPAAWSVESVRSLLAVADGLHGKYGGKIDKRRYWRAYILCAWSSGLRRCDLMSLRRSDIPASGRMAIIQAKTGRHVIGTLNADAMTAMDELCAQHKANIVFPLWCLLRCWRKIAKRIVRLAGIGLSIGHLRHSSGTAVENAHPGSGPQFFGNTPAVFYSSYYDRTLATDLPQPPPLGTP